MLRPRARLWSIPRRRSRFGRGLSRTTAEKLDAVNNLLNGLADELGELLPAGPRFLLHPSLGAASLPFSVKLSSVRVPRRRNFVPS
jgi:hypothetical protein